MMRNKLPVPVPLIFVICILLAACTQETNVPEPAPTATATIISEPVAAATPEPAAPIVVPFVRDGSIYLYEDGTETLLVENTQQTTPEACFKLIYPFLSPDGKYLAYIEQTGEPPEEGSGCSAGYLQIIEISTATHQATDYRIHYFRWTASNLLNFSPNREIDRAAQNITLKNIYFDPASQEETVFETVFDQDESTFEETMLSADFPTDNLEKLIRYRDSNYYQVDTVLNEETFLFDDTQVNDFLDWSPSGRYAIFASAEQSANDFEVIELVVDTQQPDTVTEIVVGRGAAGGDISTGRKWYFEQGFVVYCREELYFTDGRPPLQLTNDSGGGCHNEEGFVATSPGGEYAFLKFQDRFELHDIDGNAIVVQEAEAVAKGRLTPKNFIWRNDDYMIMFESVSGGNNGGIENPKVYLFDHQANIIKPLIENAYLVEEG
jgi:hypothetical protein